MLQVPKEAKFVYGEKRTEPLMGGGFLAVFELPPTKTPEQWLNLMAKQAKLSGCRKSTWKYDCGGDVSRLEYIPSRKVFEAEYMWD